MRKTLKNARRRSTKRKKREKPRFVGVQSIKNGKKQPFVGVRRTENGENRLSAAADE